MALMSFEASLDLRCREAVSSPCREPSYFPLLVQAKVTSNCLDGSPLNVDDRPSLLVSQARIERHDELAHGGDQGHFERFAARLKALIERFKRVVPAHGHEGSHIKHAAYGGSAAEDGSLAF